MTTPKLKAERPLSPHLLIYRPQISSVMSILHRITGVALSAGSLLLAYWLYTAAYDPTAFRELAECLQSTVGMIALFGWSAAFYYHLCSGIRHMMWDTGKGFELSNMHKTGYLVLAATALLTAVTWALILGGGA